MFDWVAKKKKAQGEMYAQKYNEANKATLGEFKKGDLVKIKNVKRKGKFNKKYNPLLYPELYGVVDSDGKGVYDIKAVKGNHEVKTRNGEMLEKVYLLQEFTLNEPNKEKTDVAEGSDVDGNVWDFSENRRDEA